MQEADALYARVTSDEFPVNPPPEVTPDATRSRVAQLEAHCEMLVALFATGCHWDTGHHTRVWAGALERLVNLPPPSGRMVWLNLRLYPALLALYAGGIAAVASERYDNIRALLTVPLVMKPFEGGEARPIVLELSPARVLERDNARLLYDQDFYTPMNNRLFEALRAPLRTYLPHEPVYERAFDRFEYAVGLVHADLYHSTSGEFSLPVPRFAWKRHNEVKAIIEQGNDVVSRLTAAGQFSKSADRAREIKAGADAVIWAAHKRWH